MADLHIDESRARIARAKATLDEFSRGAVNDFYWLGRQLDALQDLIDTLHPFKSGEVVELVDPPDMANAPGWHCARHLFVAGQRCIVREREWSTELHRWLVSIEFENETFVHPYTGERLPVDRPGLYCKIHADRFRRIGV